MELKQASILITGGANGIGRGIVEKLINEGCIISIIDKDKKALHDLVKKYPKINYIDCDLTKFEDVTSAINSILQKVKIIHGLVNNAGIIKNASLVNLLSKEKRKQSIELWHEVLNVNLTSVYYVTANVAEHMVLTRTKGVIVNIASISANGNAGQSAYSATKAGVIGLSKTWAKELGPMGIRCVAISPGFLDTTSTKSALNEQQIEHIVKSTPIRRIGMIEEIADAVMFACKNDFYTGKVLEVDGGLVF